MNKENCALKLVDEITPYYDARSKKHQIKLIPFHDMKTYRGTRGIVRTILISTLDGSGEFSLRLGTHRQVGCMGPRVVVTFWKEKNLLPPVGNRTVYNPVRNLFTLQATRMKMCAVIIMNSSSSIIATFLWETTATSNAWYKLKINNVNRIVYLNDDSDDKTMTDGKGKICLHYSLQSLYKNWGPANQQQTVGYICRTSFVMEIIEGIFTGI